MSLSRSEDSKDSARGHEASVKVACLQTRLWPDYDSAIAEALDLAAQTDPDTTMLFLPEYCGGLKTESSRFAPPVSDVDAHPVLHALRQHAADTARWIVIGSIAVDADASGRYSNRGFVISDTGAIVSDYSKIHLFDVQLAENKVYRESDTVYPGDQLSLVSTPVGVLGHTICYDLRFPQLYRDLAHSGAEVLAIPAAFTRLTGEAHWHALCRARAIENGAYVIAPCATGAVSGGGEAYGHSLIIDPWGEVLADGGVGPGVISANIDRRRVQEARKKIPSLQHDRPWSAQESDVQDSDAPLITATVGASR